MTRMKHPCLVSLEDQKQVLVVETHFADNLVPSSRAGLSIFPVGPIFGEFLGEL